MTLFTLCEASEGQSHNSGHIDSAQGDASRQSHQAQLNLL